jgi:ASPIC/UnbV protein/type IX secretion system substrate protein/VCBS repeat protein
MKKITLLSMLFLALQFANAQDSCSSPTVLTGAGLYVVAGINGQVPTPVCAANGAITAPTLPAGEWFSYTPIQDYSVTITTGIPQNTPRVDTRLHVYTGTCGSLTCYDGDDDSGGNYSSMAIFNVTANTTYLIAFDNKWTSNGFTFQLLENAVIVPVPTPVSFVAQNVPTMTSQYNLCAVDMNNDYRDDIVGVSNNNIRIHYQNTDGTFTVADFPTPTPEHVPSWSIAAGDYNKDGYNDLLYGGGQGLTFMKSNSTGTAYTKDNPGQYIFCQRTNFVDINNDGNLDAFSCHDVDPNVYYLNDGAGNWTYYQSGTTPGAYMLGITPSGGNYASLWTDYDNDGDVDMFISKCSGPPSELHRNDGMGVFTDISAIAQINETPVQSWSSAISDFDNDGDMDILIGSNGGVGHKYFRNNLDTTNNVEEPFTNITAGSGFDADNSTNRDYIAYDFDNDGFVDVMGGGSKIMFNVGNGTFSPVTYAGIGIGAVADLNNDGFLDIQKGTSIYKNSGNANKWIKINLHGVESNSNGIGARVEIYGAWGKQIRDVRSGEGFGYMSTLSTHFGIGTASAIDKVVIRWPSGTVDTIFNPSNNQALTVTEGAFPLAVNSANANSTFSISPNPASNVLNIRSNQSIEFKSAAIFDLSGRQVHNAELLTQSVDVKSLATGTYVLVLKDKQGNQFSEKFLKN